MTRVGIIGCGRISDLHILGYRGRDDATVVALCDVDRDHAQAKAREWGFDEAAIFDDYRTLCESELVDLVEIIVPHHLHFEVASCAIAADLHVSLQKPLALNLHDADRLIAAASASPKVVRLYENFLFYPPILKAVELVDAGLIGEPLAIRLKSNGGYSPSAWAIPQSARQWRHDPASCGGGPLLFDDGHHKFALAWLFMGQPVELHSWIGSTEVGGRELDAPSLVSMRFDSGAVGSLEVVHSADLLIQQTEHYAQDDRLEITGTRGVIWVNRGHGQIGDPPAVASYANGEVKTYDCPTGWEQSFIGATRSLLDTLRDAAAPILGFAEGRDVLAAALGAQRAAQLGHPVGLDAPIGRPSRDVRESLLSTPLPLTPNS